MSYCALLKRMFMQWTKKWYWTAGCGDGRLCYELKNEKNNRCRYLIIRRVLLHLHVRSIPEHEFFVQDLKDVRVPYEFDVIILMEVLKHFIPDQVQSILFLLSKVLKKTGSCLLRFQQRNMKISDKHYQHFSRESYRRPLCPIFIIERLPDTAGTVLKENS